MIVIVPRGAEAAAVRRAKPHARIVEIAAGAAAGASLPADLPAGATIVVLGLCGALRDLRVGDVAVYHRIAGIRSSSSGDEEWSTSLQGRAIRGMVEGHYVRACTTDHVVTSAAERAELAARFDADVVDMESASIASALADRDLACAIVRVVSDDARRDLPALQGVIGTDGRLRIGRLMAAFLRSPFAAVAFVGGALRALRRLEAVMRTIDDPAPGERAVTTHAGS